MQASLPANPQKQEWTRVWHNPQLDVGLFQARYIQHAYPRHSHDYYVICVIDRGVQSFTHEKTKFFTPPGGVIFINPGVVHTGEAADAGGFEMRCLYPTFAHMEQAVYELTGRHRAAPEFGTVRIDDRLTRESILACHRSLADGASELESESLFTGTLAHLAERYAEIRSAPQRSGREQRAVEQARRYLEECYADGITLTALAQHVSLSPFYLLRVFRAEVGMPPHAYLDNVRIRHAQKLIEAGRPLADIAAQVGYSSQSHLTRRFKQRIGVTPGQYARPIQTHQE